MKPSKQPGPRRNHTTKLTRRAALRRLAGLGTAAALSGCVLTRETSSPAGKNHAAVQRENAQPGTRDWLLQSTRVDHGTKYRCPWIEGYCARTSVHGGEEISFHVSTNPTSDFTLDVYRMGYYGGAGGRCLRRLGPFQGHAQPDPPVGRNRVRECQWEPCATIRIPRDWLSGVYLGKLTALRDGCQSYVIFIVRDDREADFIFQCSDTTWQAYNRWPSQFALYDDGQNQWYWGNNVAVSFDRPYGKYCQILDAPLSTGSGEWFLWEFPFAYWLESLGYDVTYLSNVDTHADPRALRRARGFLSVGHDEYYSSEMFHQLKDVIRDGLNVGFFSGNTCCGRIQFAKSSRGVPNRIFSREDFFGPDNQADVQRLPTMGLLPHTSPNSAELVGARNLAPFTGGADWICIAPDHWMFAGTGMKQGDGIPGLVGWEWHGDPAKIPGLEIVASGPTQNNPGELNGGVYTATIYPGPKGNFVFNASTCWWGDGLSAPPGYLRPSVYTTPKGPDPRVQQITRNILEAMRR
jgi:hypothetical protein